jgi:hypothetical protein
MLNKSIKSLLDNGLFFATLMIQTMTATLTTMIIFIVLFVQNWFHKNWP